MFSLNYPKRELVDGKVCELVEEYEAAVLQLPNKVYVVNDYPRYFDAQLVSQHTPRDSMNELQTLLRVMGIYPFRHQNINGFIKPVRGDGACFYNAIDAFCELFRVTIDADFALNWMVDIDSGPVYECLKIWYYNDLIVTPSMKLRLITAQYILEHRDYFAVTLETSVDQFVADHILVPDSLADEQAVYALSQALNLNITVVMTNGSNPAIYTPAPTENGRVLLLFGNAHYELLISERQMAAIAESRYGNPGEAVHVRLYFDLRISIPIPIRNKYIYDFP